MGVMGVWTVLCVVLPGTLTLAQALVSTCPPGVISTCALVLSPAPVCDFATNVSYSHPSCAQCNNVSNYFDGSCSVAGINTTASCPPGVATNTIEYARCLNWPAEVVCTGNGTSAEQFFNHYCAICNGHAPNDLAYNACGASPTEVIIGSCPTSASAAMSAGCVQSNLDPVCTITTDTYRNPQCAICNGFQWPSETRSGVCSATSHPCDAQTCHVNSHCERSLVDCSFEHGMCGWSEGSGASASLITNAFGGPASGSGGSTQFLWIASGGNTSNTTHPAVLSPPANVSAATNCTLSFSAWLSAGARLEVMTRWQQGAAVAAFQPVYVAAPPPAPASPAWRTYALGLSGGSMSLVTVGISAVGGPVAVDNVDIRCGAAQGQGACACDSGFSATFHPVLTGQVGSTAYPVRECTPTLGQALRSDSRLTNFTSLIRVANLEQLLLSPGQNFTVVAPTDSAFAALPSGTFAALLGNSATAAAAVNYLLLLPSALQRTGFAYLELQFARGIRALPTRATNQNLGFTLTVDPSTNVADTSHVRFGNATVIDTAGAANGEILVVDTVLLFSGNAPPPDRICGPFQCDANATCGSFPATLATDATEFAFFSRAVCPTCGGSTTPASYICGGDGLTYRNFCHLACYNQVAAYSGGCLRPRCTCAVGFAGNGSTCIHTGTFAPTPAPTHDIYFSPTPPPIPYIEFYLNGSYFVVVQGRRMMMDEPFSEAIRLALGGLSAAGLTNDQLGGLLIELFPSARMPGYIQVRVGSYDAAVLQQVGSAVDRGLISVVLFHPDFNTNTASLPPTTFVAFSMTRLTLPPISRYYFYVDTSYTRVICHPDPINGFCTTNTIVKQEDLADAIRWYFQSPGFGNDPDIGNSSLVHLWPSNSTRPGIVGQIEVVATCLQAHAQLLLRLRQTVNSGQLSVFFGVSATEEEVYVAKALPPLPGNIAGQYSLQTELGRYPGFVGVPPTGNIEVTESQAGDGDATNHESGMAGHLQVYYSMITTEPLSSGGLHIHTGTDCATAGPHFYSTRDDPWITTWQSDASGIATGFFDVFSGIDVNDNLGRVVVVHSSTGARIGCGQLNLVEAPVGLDRGFDRLDLTSLATLSVVFPVALSALAPSGRTAIAAAVRARVESTAGPGLVQSVTLSPGQASGTVVFIARFTASASSGLIQRTLSSITTSPISVNVGTLTIRSSSAIVSTAAPSPAPPTTAVVVAGVPVGHSPASSDKSGDNTLIIVGVVLFVLLVVPLLYVLVFAPRFFERRTFSREGTDFVNPAFGATVVPETMSNEAIYDNVPKSIEAGLADARTSFGGDSGDYAEVGSMTALSAV